MVARKQAQRTREIRLDDPAPAPPIPSGNALRRYRQISRGLMATDAACLVIALLVGYYLRYDNRPMPAGESLTVLLAPLLWLAAFQAFGLYAPQHLSPPEEFRRIFGAASVGIVLLVVASYWSHSDFSRLWMGVTLVLALGLELVTRRAWRHHQLRLKYRGRLSFRTLIVVTKLAIEDAIGLAAALGDHDDLGTALDAYERDRKASLLLLQREARNSARWFESLPRYIDLGPEQFATLLHQRRSRLLTRMSPSGYYRLRRTSEEFALIDRLWHWASSRRREREVRRGSRA